MEDMPPNDRGLPVFFPGRTCQVVVNSFMDMYVPTWGVSPWNVPRDPTHPPCPMSQEESRAQEAAKKTTHPQAASHFAPSFFTRSPLVVREPEESWLLALGAPQNDRALVNPMLGLYPKPANSPDGSCSSQGAQLSIPTQPCRLSPPLPRES